MCVFGEIWKKNNLPVFHFSSPPYYPGLSRSSLNCPLSVGENLLKKFLQELGQFGTALKDFDREQLERFKKILLKYPQSEENWFFTFRQSLKPHSKVFLGNSSPIRLWDKAAFFEKTVQILGQSGVNGIDGLVSRFLGECEPEKNNVGILGDLSLLYDMPGFWKAKELPPWTLVVINNFGGQIFSRLFKNPAFLNKHDLSFSSLAKMWNLPYVLHEDTKTFCWPEQPHSLVEVRPKQEDTQAGFKEYMSLWDRL